MTSRGDGEGRWDVFLSLQSWWAKEVLTLLPLTHIPCTSFHLSPPSRWTEFSLSYSFFFLHLLLLCWTIFVSLPQSLFLTSLSSHTPFSVTYCSLGCVLPLHFHTSAPPAGLCLSLSTRSPSLFALILSLSPVTKVRNTKLLTCWNSPWGWLPNLLPHGYLSADLML